MCEFVDRNKTLETGWGIFCCDLSYFRICVNTSHKLSTSDILFLSHFWLSLPVWKDISAMIANILSPYVASVIWYDGLLSSLTQEKSLHTPRAETGKLLQVGFQVFDIQPLDHGVNDVSCIRSWVIIFIWRKNAQDNKMIKIQLTFLLGAPIFSWTLIVRLRAAVASGKG